MTRSDGRFVQYLFKLIHSTNYRLPLSTINYQLSIINYSAIISFTTRTISSILGLLK
jgi:hypothetical protein